MRELIASSAPVFPAPSVGDPGFFGGFVFNPTNLVTNVVIAAGLARAMKFVLPYPATVRKITAYVATGLAAATARFGIWDKTGSILLIDSGLMSVAASAASITTALALAVNLPINSYTFAFMCSSSTPTFAGIAGGVTNTAAYDRLLNTNSVRMGKSTNAPSGMNWPSTLGPLISETGELIPYVYFEP